MIFGLVRKDGKYVMFVTLNTVSRHFKLQDVQMACSTKGIKRFQNTQNTSIKFH